MINDIRSKAGLKVYGSTIPKVAEPTKTSTTAAYEEAMEEKFSTKRVPAPPADVPPADGGTTLAEAYGTTVATPTSVEQREVSKTFTDAPFDGTSCRQRGKGNAVWRQFLI